MDTRPDSVRGGTLSADIILVREIQQRLDLSRNSEQLCLPALNRMRQGAGAARIGVAALRLGLRCQQVGKPFGLGKIHPAVEDRAPGELAGFGTAQTGQSSQRSFNRPHHRPPAMSVYFRDILAGRSVGPGKPKHDSTIKLDPLRVADPAQTRAAWGGQSASQRSQRNGRPGPGNAQHR